MAIARRYSANMPAAMRVRDRRDKRRRKLGAVGISPLWPTGGVQVKSE